MHVSLRRNTIQRSGGLIKYKAEKNLSDVIKKFNLSRKVRFLASLFIVGGNKHGDKNVEKVFLTVSLENSNRQSHDHKANVISSCHVQVCFKEHFLKTLMNNFGCWCSHKQQSFPWKATRTFKQSFISGTTMLNGIVHALRKFKVLASCAFIYDRKQHIFREEQSTIINV